MRTKRKRFWRKFYLCVFNIEMSGDIVSLDTCPDTIDRWGCPEHIDWHIKTKPTTFLCIY